MVTILLMAARFGQHQSLVGARECHPGARLLPGRSQDAGSSGRLGTRRLAPGLENERLRASSAAFRRSLVYATRNVHRE